MKSTLNIHVKKIKFRRVVVSPLSDLTEFPWKPDLQQFFHPYDDYYMTCVQDAQTLRAIVLNTKKASVS